MGNRQVLEKIGDRRDGARRAKIMLPFPKITCWPGRAGGSAIKSKASYKPEVGVGISPHHRPLQQSRGKTA